MATHARTVVPILPDPWAALALKCQRDAAAIVDAATLRASAEGRTRLTGAIEALTSLYGNLMASNAKLAAEVASLRGQVERRGWLPRLLGGRGARVKAITIRHPWPWAICYLGKPLENRDWRPSLAQLRPGEKFAIHAGKMPSVIEIRGAFEGMHAMDAIDEFTKVPTLAQLRTQESAIVAVATYGGAVTAHSSKWFVGLYGWKLLGERDDVPLIVLPEPVRCQGHQGLWNVPSDVLAKMRAQFATREDRG